MLQRLERPEEIASAVAFLLSDDASAITAADIPVEGGYLSLGPEGLGKLRDRMIFVQHGSDVGITYTRQSFGSEAPSK